MNFSEMIYNRPDPAELKKEIYALTQNLKTASSYAEAKTVFVQKDRWERHVCTLCTLVEIRHSINTADEFYDKEKKFFNSLMPELEEYLQAWTEALLESPFADQFSKEFGELMLQDSSEGRGLVRRGHRLGEGVNRGQHLLRGVLQARRSPRPRGEIRSISRPDRHL